MLGIEVASCSEDYSATPDEHTVIVFSSAMTKGLGCDSDLFMNFTACRTNGSMDAWYLGQIISNRVGYVFRTILTFKYASRIMEDLSFLEAESLDLMWSDIRREDEPRSDQRFDQGGFVETNDVVK